MNSTAELKSVRFPQIKTELPGPKAKEIVDRDAKYVSPSYTRPYPLVINRAKGAMVEDVDGNVFLDFIAGVAVCSTGHSHPRIVEAIRKQVDDFIHICAADYYYPQLPALAEKLLGFRTSITLEDGMRALVGWLANQAAVDRVDEATAELVARGLAR